MFGEEWDGEKKEEHEQSTLTSLKRRFLRGK